MNGQIFIANLLSPWTLHNGTMRAPAVLMVEGVHEGSHGPIFWASHILKQNAHKWQGVPVVIDHPQVNDEYVSIDHSPEIRALAIGRVRNPYFDESRKGIRATIEVPSDHPRRALIESIKEISVGAFADENYQTGEWRGERYEACAITMSPDHVALLSTATGACSFEDGCGIRANISSASRTILVNAARELLQKKDNNFWRKVFQKGANDMSEQVAPLLPNDIQAEVGREEITVNESDWEAAGLLLPPEVREIAYHQKKKKGQEQGDDYEGEVEPLMLPPELL